MTASIRLHSILIVPILSQYCLPGPDTDLFLVCSSRQAQMILYAIPQPNCKSFLPRFTRPSTCRAAGCSRPLEGVNSNLRKTHSTMRSSVIAYAMGSSPSGSFGALFSASMVISSNCGALPTKLFTEFNTLERSLSSGPPACGRFRTSPPAHSLLPECRPYTGTGIRRVPAASRTAGT